MTNELFAGNEKTSQECTAFPPFSVITCSALYDQTLGIEWNILWCCVCSQYYICMHFLVGFTRSNPIIIMQNLVQMQFNIAMPFTSLIKRANAELSVLINTSARVYFLVSTLCSYVGCLYLPFSCKQLYFNFRHTLNLLICYGHIWIHVRRLTFDPNCFDKTCLIFEVINK